LINISLEGIITTMITVYSKNNCSFCLRAKQLLETKGVTYAEINIEEDMDARQRLVNAGVRSVPQIFINEQMLPGGYNGLASQPEEFFTKLKEN